MLRAARNAAVLEFDAIWVRVWCVANEDTRRPDAVCLKSGLRTLVIMFTPLQLSYAPQSNAFGPGDTHS